MRRFERLRKFILVMLLLSLIGSMLIGVIPNIRSEYRDDLFHGLNSVLGWGAWGPVALGLAFVPSCILFLPGTPLTLFSGFAYGPIVGSIAASFGCTAGATAAFWIGRTVGRDWVERRVRHDARFKALDDAVAASALRIVFLTRLSPFLPFPLLNYAFGLTRVSFRDFVLGTWAGTLPSVVLYVYLGSATDDLTDLIAGRALRSPWQQGMFVLAIVITIGVTIWVGLFVKRALARAGVPSAAGSDS